MRRDNSLSSQHKGVYWDKKAKKWLVQVYHGGKKEYLGRFATEEEAKARNDARCQELGIDPDAGISSGFRGVSWDKTNRKWEVQIKVGGKRNRLGSRFEATARGEVDAALAYDTAARAAGRSETANFELAAVSRTAQESLSRRSVAHQPAAMNLHDAADAVESMTCVQCDRCGKWRELVGALPDALPDTLPDVLPDEWFCELNADQKYSSCEVAEQEWSNDGDGELTAASKTALGQPPATLSSPAEQSAIAVDPGALAAEIKRRRLVRLHNGSTSRRKGVSWHQPRKMWKARVYHGGKKECIGYFTTEEEAKARYDARCLELGVHLDTGTSSDFCGVSWNKIDRKWKVQIKVDGKSSHLGCFEATARGEVDAALVYDAAVRAAGRPEKANFELLSVITASAAAPAAATTAVLEAEETLRPPGQLSWQQLPADLTCTICMDPPAAGTAVRTLACTHRFCAACLDRWWATAPANSCPTCRKCFASLRSSTMSTAGPAANLEPESDISDVAARAAGRPEKAIFKAASGEVAADGAQCLRTEHRTRPYRHMSAAESASNSDEEEWTEEGRGRQPRKVARGRAAAMSGTQANTPGGRNEAAASFNGAAPRRQASWAMYQSEQGGARMRAVWSALCRVSDGGRRGSTDRGCRGSLDPLGAVLPFKERLP
jgi:hypothetical protein